MTIVSTGLALLFQVLARLASVYTKWDFQLFLFFVGVVMIGSSAFLVFLLYIFSLADEAKHKQDKIEKHLDQLLGVNSELKKLN